MGVLDIDAVNAVFSEAFTERYRRDGLVGVRVPQLNPAIWRYAIDDAHDGAMVWRDDRREIVAFVVAHQSGIEGWMGPLAVRPEWQGTGLGKNVVNTGIAWLRQRGCRIIGLETMPRTMDNIGFYAALGFRPGRLTITLTVEALECEGSASLLSEVSPPQRAAVLTECQSLTDDVLPGYDFRRELELTLSLGLGDVILLHRDGALDGFALVHATALVEGRARDELRVLKVVLRSREESRVGALAAAVSEVARRFGTRRAAIRVQSEYEDVFGSLVALGARVRWTDLRMTLDGFSEARARDGLVLSNWEI